MGTSNIYVGGKELVNYTSSTDELSLSSSVTGQNRPYFFCSEHSTNPSIASTETELTAWTEGTNGDPDSKFDTSTGRFEIRKC